MIKSRIIPSYIKEVSMTQYAQKRVNSYRSKLMYDRIMMRVGSKRHTIYEPHTGEFTIDLPSCRIKEYLIEAIDGAVYDPVYDTISVTDPSDNQNYTISNIDIENFLKSNVVRSFHEEGKTPFYPTLYKNDGKNILNTWVWNGIEYDTSTDINDSKPFLDWVYYLIAGGLNEEDTITKSVADYQQIISATFDSLTSEAERQFHIIMHWTAERYQQPLKCADTTLMLTSTGQNIGKSTMATLVGRIIDYGFNRPMDTEDFMGKYDDTLRGPGIIDVSDIRGVSPKKLESRIKERVRPSAGLKKFNMKGEKKETGHYHVSFIISANDSDFVLVQRGQTSRFHMIEGITAERKELLKSEVAQIITKISGVFPAKNLPMTATGQHLKFMQSVSLVLDNIAVNGKLTSESDDYQTALLKKKIETTSGELQKIFEESYRLMSEIESVRNKGWTTTKTYNELYNIIIDPNPALRKIISPATLTALLTKETNSHLVKLQKSGSRGSYKICKHEPEDEANEQDRSGIIGADNKVIDLQRERGLERIKRLKNIGEN